jgi:RimJ/RimL family protein N-acetyltransferase
MPTPDADLFFDPAKQTWTTPTTEAWPDPMAPVPGDPLDAAGLTLSAWAPSDAPVLAALLSDESLWRFLPEPYPGTLDPNAARALVSAANANPDGDVVRALRRDGMPIGQLRLTMLPCGTRAEISYWLGQSERGKGLGAALLQAGIQRAFAHMPHVLKLWARVHEGNAPSRRLLEGAGFYVLRTEGDWTWMKLRRAI